MWRPLRPLAPSMLDTDGRRRIGEASSRLLTDGCQRHVDIMPLPLTCGGGARARGTRGVACVERG
eukprot:352515-Chlamydomonas_euryale.AAC.1